MAKTYKTIMIEDSTAERLTAEFEAAGLRVRSQTSGGQRPIGLLAVVDLIEANRLQFAKLCKARAVETVYSQPAAPASTARSQRGRKAKATK